ncbi:MAG: acyltransferase family protein [Deltaproteobacteria bacterium]|jgi:1-acyl-sn-glycerol-3-phosphate acyltransferase|nr:acyltransferase family protein [Deltaproteobacteria bacterium]MBT6433608.1 acyltransferase family protein [Deltaproteobacteria bacterium]MBT6488806.1 acyltransferase family protein [Deltaproteobacteria bacterium]
MSDVFYHDLRDEELVAKGLGYIHRIWRPWHRAEVSGVENVPKGPALYVGNHNGGLLSIDSFLFASAVFREHGMDAVPYGLAHDFVMDTPVMGDVLRKIGAVRAGHEEAAKLFLSGRKALVYPGGDIDSLRPYSERNMVKFDGRVGYIKLALKHGVPIVPVVAQGAQGTFYVFSDNRWLAKLLRLDKLMRVKAVPLMFTVPWGITLGASPPYMPLPVKIRIKILEPIVFSHTGEAACEDGDYVLECNHRVWSRLQTALTQMSLDAEGSFGPQG